VTTQEQSHKNSQLFARVKTVKTRLGLTWDEVAKKLGNVDRSLFFHVKANKNGLGDNVLYLLEQAEAELGIKVHGQTKSITRDTFEPPTAGKVTLDDFQRLEKRLSEFVVEFAGELARLRKKMEDGP
jgi:hypothetical protein